MLAALNNGVARLCIKGDSNLVVKQTNGSYSIKEPALATYRTIVQKLLDRFEEIRIEHAPRSYNRHPDALATLASKVEVGDEPTKIEVMKRTMPCSVSELVPLEDVDD